MRSLKLISVLCALVLLSYNLQLYAEEDFIDEEKASDPSLQEILAEPVDLMPATPLRLTLEDCIRISLEHNAKLQATDYGIDAARAQLREASVGGWPVVDYEYRTAPIPSDVSNAMDSFFSGDMAWWNKLKIGVGVPVYSFGKLSLAKEMAKSGVAASEIQAFQEKNSLVSKVRQLYYGVLLTEEVGRLLKEAHTRLEGEIKGREKDEGEEVSEEASDDEPKSPIDTLKMKVFLYDLEKRLAETRAKETLALDGLRVQMGLSSGTVFNVYSRKLRPVEASLKPFEDYLTAAMAKRPDVKLLATGDRKSTRLNSSHNS